MVNNCCIKGCPTKAGQGFKLHKFPKNDELRLKWCQFIESIDQHFVLRSSHAICENHFRELDYTIPITSIHGQRILNKNAIPSRVGKTRINIRHRIFLKSPTPTSGTSNEQDNVIMPSFKYSTEKDHTYSTGVISPPESPITIQNVSENSTSTTVISNQLIQIPTENIANKQITYSTEISMPQLPIITTQNSLVTTQNVSGSFTSDTVISNEIAMSEPCIIKTEKDHTYSTEISPPKLLQNIPVTTLNVSESSNKLVQVILPNKNFADKNHTCSTEISIPPQLSTKTAQNSSVTKQNVSKTCNTVIPNKMSMLQALASKALSDKNKFLSSLYLSVPHPLTECTQNIPDKLQPFKKGRRKVFVGDFKSLEDLDCPNDRLKYWYASQSAMAIQKQKLKKLNKEKNILFKQVQKLSDLLKTMDKNKKTISKSCNTDLKNLHSSSDDTVINKFIHTIDHSYSVVLKKKTTLDTATICQNNIAKESVALIKNSNVKNTLFSELQTLELHLPPNWHKHLSRDTKYLAISEIIFMKKENQPTSFLRKNIIISHCLSITCNILGKNINIDKLIDSVKIENKKQLENLIKEIDMLKICRGLDIINTKNYDPCSPNDYFFDSMKIKRHLECPMLISNGAYCSFCEKIIQINQQKLQPTHIKNEPC